MNFIEVDVLASENGKWRVTSAGSGEVVLASPSKLKVGEKAIFGVRPQHLAIADGDLPEGRNALNGKVQLIERLGTETIVNLLLPSGETIIASLEDDRPLDMNSEIALSYETAKAHLFAKEPV